MPHGKDFGRSSITSDSRCATYSDSILFFTTCKSCIGDTRMESYSVQVIATTIFQREIDHIQVQIDKTQPYDLGKVLNLQQIQDYLKTRIDEMKNHERS